MLYQEFLQGTGAKDNYNNYKAYEVIEAAYMADILETHEEAYEMGRKLIDNSLTDQQKQWNADIDAQIETIKEAIASRKVDIELYEAFLKDEACPEWAARWKEGIKANKRYNSMDKARINELKQLKY